MNSRQSAMRSLRDALMLFFKTSLSEYFITWINAEHPSKCLRSFLHIVRIVAQETAYALTNQIKEIPVPILKYLR